MHLAIDFTKLTISFNVYQETEIYFPCAEMLSAGWGSQLSLKKERLSNPGGLITRRAVSIFAESKWPYVQINPPLLLLKYTMYLGFISQ
jgi:hypothetical protein